MTVSGTGGTYVYRGEQGSPGVQERASARVRYRPRYDRGEDGLERYLENKSHAEELDEKILRTEELIDQIVCRLYGLTDQEIEIVEAAVGD